MNAWGSADASALGDESYSFLEVDWNDPRAIALRDTMDAEIQPRYAGRAIDPNASARALAVNPEDVVLTVLAVGPDQRPVGHAALRRLGSELEVKRVMVLAEARGHGLARALMAYLEASATTEGARRLILQTGDRQPEAVALYQSLGYRPIPIYQPYTDAIPFSMCFEKLLAPSETPAGRTSTQSADSVVHSDHGIAQS